jgi:hypothetical protein
VLEHPEASHAWRTFGLIRPLRGGGWSVADDCGGWTCCVEQGHYGHPARKATWLYVFVGNVYVETFANRMTDGMLPSLRWGRSAGRRLDEGFHSKAERDAARAAGRRPIARLSKVENMTTPIGFRDLLLSMARTVEARRAA